MIISTCDILHLYYWVENYNIDVMLVSVYRVVQSRRRKEKKKEKKTGKLNRIGFQSKLINMRLLFRRCFFPQHNRSSLAAARRRGNWKFNRLRGFAGASIRMFILTDISRKRGISTHRGGHRIRTRRIRRQYFHAQILTSDGRSEHR